jgi:hypothetical protein
MGRNDAINVYAIYGADKDLVEELADRRKELYQQIRELDDLFDQQSSIVGDLAAPMVTDNPRVHAFSASRQAAIEETGGLFGFIDI